MARKGLNKKSLQNGMDQSSMDPGLVSDVQTMLNMGSSVEDVIVTLANEGYETDTITGLLMNVGYTGDDITTAFSSLQQQQQQASQQVEEVQDNVDGLPQQQFGGSPSYRTADQFMRGVEGSDYYADPYSRFLPMNLFSRNSPVSLLPFISTAAGSLFGGKDRDGDGLMDGVFRDRKAKRKINKDRFGKDRRNEKQLAKDLAKYSTIDFDSATGEYDINLLSRDPERYLSKNKKVRDAYLENAAQSGITLEDFVKRFSKNKPSAQALLDYRKGLQSGDIPEGTSYGISPEGVESSYMDMGDNPYLYNTMMGLNTLRNQTAEREFDIQSQIDAAEQARIDEVRALMNDPNANVASAGFADYQKQIEKRSLDQGWNEDAFEQLNEPGRKSTYVMDGTLKNEGAGLQRSTLENAFINRMANLTDGPDGNRFLNEYDLADLDPSRFEVNNPNLPTLQNPMGNQTTRIDKIRAILNDPNSNVASSRFAEERERARDGLQDMPGFFDPSQSRFNEINENIDGTGSLLERRYKGYRTNDTEPGDKDKWYEITDDVESPNPDVYSVYNQNTNPFIDSRGSRSPVDFIQSVNLYNDLMQSGAMSNNPLLEGNANAMRNYLAQMNANADVGLGARGLGEEAGSSIIQSKTYDDDPTNDNLEYMLGPFRYVAAGPGVPRGGAMVNAGQGFGNQTATGFVGSDGNVIHDGSKYGMDFNPKWNYNYVNKFADKLKFEEDFANDPLFEYYEGRKLPVKQQRKTGGESLDIYQDKGEFDGPGDPPKSGFSIGRVEQEKSTLTPQQEMMLGVSPGEYKPIIDWDAKRENREYNKQLKVKEKEASAPGLKYTYMYDQGTMADNIEDFPLKGFDVGVPMDSGTINRKRLTNQVERWYRDEDRDPSKFTFTPNYDTDAEVGTPEYQNYIDMMKGRASDLGINVDWTKQKTGGESLDAYQLGDEVINALQQFTQSYPDTNQLQNQFSEAGTMDWADTLDIQNQVSANQRAASTQGLPRQDQADTFSFRNAFATGAMDNKMQDYYDGLEGLANEDELTALLPEAENFDPGIPMGPMTVYPGLDNKMVDKTMDETMYEAVDETVDETMDETVDESGLTRKQKRALRREEKGTLGERINAKGNKFLDRMIDGRFGDVASTIGTIGVEGANIFNQFAENAKLIQAREDLKTLGSSERKGVSYREEDQGTDVNTGLRADLLRGSTPTGTQALMGNFKSGGESLNASSSVIAKLIAAGADIEIL
jgi:hypothetical protein